MRSRFQHTKNARRAALLVPLAAGLAAGCTSTGSAGSTSVAAHPHSVAGGVADIPAAAYLAVEQNYGVPQGEDGPVRLQYAVTDPQTIAELTGMINALPASPSQGAIPCPEETAPAFDLGFQDAKGGKVLAQVDFECFGVLVTEAGRKLPILSSAADKGESPLMDRVKAILARYAARAAG
jgi:hypothetical protein